MAGVSGKFHATDDRVWREGNLIFVYRYNDATGAVTDAQTVNGATLTDERGNGILGAPLLLEIFNNLVHIQQLNGSAATAGTLTEFGYFKGRYLWIPSLEKATKLAFLEVDGTFSTDTYVTISRIQ